MYPKTDKTFAADDNVLELKCA